jgi:hypothetical protein
MELVGVHMILANCSLSVGDGRSCDSSIRRLRGSEEYDCGLRERERSQILD